MTYDRRSRIIRTDGLLAAAALLWTLEASVVVMASPQETAHAYLARTFGLTQADIQEVDQGRVFSTTLPVDDPREVSTIGVIRMALEPEFYATRLTDIGNFKKSDAVVQIGTFSNPPRLEDVRGLTLDAADLRNLRGCRVNDCAVQLPADLIERFRTGIDWKAPDAAVNANVIMRQGVLDFVTRYRTTGADAASMVYADGRDRVKVAAEFRDLLEDEQRVLPRFPELRQYLLTATGPPASLSSDLIYWSKEKVSTKTVLTVTHLTILRTGLAAPPAYIAASKQLYANHYFDASLGLTVLVADNGATPATYVVYINRSRVDTFKGLFGGVARKLVRSRARSTVSDLLARLRTRLEREFSTGPPNLSARSPAMRSRP